MRAHVLACVHTCACLRAWVRASCVRRARAGECVLHACVRACAGVCVRVRSCAYHRGLVLVDGRNSLEALLGGGLLRRRLDDCLYGE